MPKNMTINSQTERIKADFVTIASHQLRTPISAIRWSLDMLLAEKSGKLNSKQKEYINQAYYNADFLSRVVSSLLTVSRIDDRGILLDFQKTDIKKIVFELVEKYNPYCNAYNCSMDVVLPKNLPAINTDSFKLKNILNVLLDNAVRYSKRSSRIIVTVKRENSHLLFKVEDSGIGIPKIQQQLVFTRFFRADNAIRLQTEGMGLQLYIAKKTIEAMGGKIWFKSSSSGTTFYFRLPLKPKRVSINKPEKKLLFDNDEIDYLYRNLTDGLILVDAKQNIIKINRVIEKIFNVNEGDVRGKNVSEVILNADIAGSLLKDSGEKNFCLTKNKNNYRVIIFPVKNKAEIDGWVIIFYDQQKKMTKKETEDEIKREREFVAITVHELKSPLGITKWSLEMLQSENPGKLNKEQKELISQIYRGNERLLVLVRDLLNLSKLQEGKFEIEPAAIHLETIVGDIVKGFKITAKKKQVTLEWKQPKLPKVYADPSRIGQVITNLISNAVKYTGKNGTIEVKTEKKSSSELKSLIGQSMIKPNFVKNFKGYIVFSVKDNGIGINPMDQKKLFSKFFRSNDVLKSKTEGTGLGLYITKSIVNLHKGDIWFTSKIKNGSTFYFSLPVI
ncbi:PAS domain-containing protein [Candidatus Parcubacteria bacterium]|nr:MAG: PAS domain-containing protein [Candidatus Parcubacteria bacterium]